MRLKEELIEFYKKKKKNQAKNSPNGFLFNVKSILVEGVIAFFKDISPKVNAV